MVYFISADDDGLYYSARDLDVSQGDAVDSVVFRDKDDVGVKDLFNSGSRILKKSRVVTVTVRVTKEKKTFICTQMGAFFLFAFI